MNFTSEKYIYHFERLAREVARPIVLLRELYRAHTLQSAEKRYIYSSTDKPSNFADLKFLALYKSENEVQLIINKRLRVLDSKDKMRFTFLDEYTNLIFGDIKLVKEKLSSEFEKFAFANAATNLIIGIKTITTESFFNFTPKKIYYHSTSDLNPRNYLSTKIYKRFYKLGEVDNVPYQLGGSDITTQIQNASGNFSKFGRMMLRDSENFDVMIKSFWNLNQLIKASNQDQKETIIRDLFGDKELNSVKMIETMSNLGILHDERFKETRDIFTYIILHDKRINIELLDRIFPGSTFWVDREFWINVIADRHAINQETNTVSVLIEEKYGEKAGSLKYLMPDLEDWDNQVRVLNANVNSARKITRIKSITKALVTANIRTDSKVISKADVGQVKLDLQAKEVMLKFAREIRENLPVDYIKKFTESFNYFFKLDKEKIDPVRLRENIELLCSVFQDDKSLSVKSQGNLAAWAQGKHIDTGDAYALDTRKIGSNPFLSILGKLNSKEILDQLLLGNEFAPAEHLTFLKLAVFELLRLNTNEKEEEFLFVRSSELKIEDRERCVKFFTSIKTSVEVYLEENDPLKFLTRDFSQIQDLLGSKQKDLIENKIKIWFSSGVKIFGLEITRKNYSKKRAFDITWIGVAIDKVKTFYKTYERRIYIGLLILITGVALLGGINYYRHRDTSNSPIPIEFRQNNISASDALRRSPEELLAQKSIQKAVFYNIPVNPDLEPIYFTDGTSYDDPNVENNISQQPSSTIPVVPITLEDSYTVEDIKKDNLSGLLVYSPRNPARSEFTPPLGYEFISAKYLGKLTKSQTSSWKLKSNLIAVDSLTVAKLSNFVFYARKLGFKPATFKYDLNQTRVIPNSFILNGIGSITTHDIPSLLEMMKKNSATDSMASEYIAYVNSVRKEVLTTVRVKGREPIQLFAGNTEPVYDAAFMDKYSGNFDKLKTFANSTHTLDEIQNFQMKIINELVKYNKERRFYNTVIDFKNPADPKIIQEKKVAKFNFQKLFLNEEIESQQVALNPDSGFDCTIAAHSLLFNLRSFGIEAIEMPVYIPKVFKNPLHNDNISEGYIKVGHDVVQVTLPDGQLLIVDSTPPVVKGKTPDIVVESQKVKDPFWLQRMIFDFENKAASYLPLAEVIVGGVVGLTVTSVVGVMLKAKFDEARKENLIQTARRLSTVQMGPKELNFKLSENEIQFVEIFKRYMLSELDASDLLGYVKNLNTLVGVIKSLDLSESNLTQILGIANQQLVYQNLENLEKFEYPTATKILSQLDLVDKAGAKQFEKYSTTVRNQIARLPSWLIPKKILLEFSSIGIIKNIILKSFYQGIGNLEVGSRWERARNERIRKELLQNIVVNSIASVPVGSVNYRVLVGLLV